MSAPVQTWRILRDGNASEYRTCTRDEINEYLKNLNKDPRHGYSAEVKS